MKTILLTACSIGLLLGIQMPASAQKSKSAENSEEIIIRKKGGDDSKITIEIKGDDVTVNGKPLSEYKGEGITVRKIHNAEGSSLFMVPGAGNSFGSRNFSWSNDDNHEKALLGVATDKDDKGAKVSEVTDGSAADKAGLKEGDIITKVGNQKITGPEDLVEAIGKSKPKDEVIIQYERNGKSGETKATLGSTIQNHLKSYFFNNDAIANNFRDFKFDQVGPQASGTMNGFFFNGGGQRLGVRIEDLEDGDGVKITNVEENSAAEKAGLKKDDIITEIEGKKVNNVNEARSDLKELKDKTTYSVKAKRNGVESVYDVKMPKRKNNADL